MVNNYLTGIDKYILEESKRMSRLLDGVRSSIVSNHLRDSDLALGLSSNIINKKLTSNLDRYIKKSALDSIVIPDIDRFGSISDVLSDLHDATKFNSTSSSFDQIVNSSIVFQKDTVSNYLEKINNYNIDSISKFQSEIDKILVQFSNYPSLEKLIGLKNSPFDVLSEFTLPEVANHTAIPDSSLEEIEQLLSEELEAATDYNLLTDKAKKRLLYLYHTYIVPILVGFLFLYIQNNQELAQLEFDKAKTPSEVRTIARSPNKNFSHKALSGFRVTTAEGLNIRDEPSMKSDVVGFLPLGTVVDVIDKSNRSWLLVEVEIEEEMIVGWIGRAHTKYFK